MRQLFLPACVCLVTWSSATDIADSKLSFDEFTGSMATAVSTAPLADPTPRDVALPQDVALPIDDLAIEPPVPSGVVVNNGIPAGIALPPIKKPVIARTTEEICNSLTDAAQSNDLPIPFFIRLLFQESRFKPGVVSSAGAQGMAQFMPETAADMGLENPFDPLQAIPASARLLRNLIAQFGNLGLAAAAYNAGPKRIQDWLADRRKNKLPEETQGYVKIITGHAAESWSKASARHPAEKLPRRAPCQKAAGLLAWNGPDAVPLPAPSPQHMAALNGKDKKHTKTKTTEIKTATLKSTANKAAGRQVATSKNQHQKTTKQKPARTPERVAQR